MLESFIISFRLKNTYMANSIIYSIKGLPVLNKILPNRLYKSGGLKVFANIVSILWEIVNTFLGKFLYVLLMLFLMTTLYDTNQADTFLHIFTFLTLIGAISNTYMFNPTKDKYYAIILMNMDAGKYAISNYAYSMLKVVVGFLPFTILFGLGIDVPLWLCILMPFFVVAVKICAIFYDIWKYKRTGIVTNENSLDKLRWVLIALLLALAYGLPVVHVTLTRTIFAILLAACLLFGIYSLTQILAFKDYKKLYKKLLTPDNVYMVKKATSTETVKKNIAKSIEYDGSFTSNKEGFAYFHELFVKRHRKLLTKSAEKQSFFLIAVVALVLMIVHFVPQSKEPLNYITLTFLPYFVFIMYMLNRGTTIAQAMFMNCDHSMLTYRIYRTPQVLLGIFKERLKTMISINLMPASIIGLGLALILYATGGTDNPLNYLVLFISINAMSIFFSVHYLVMYYLLQPYTVSTELKSGTYKAAQLLTYLVCYVMIHLRLPTIQFGIATIVFCVAYTAISLVLVYRYAPKTFKIRL